MKDSGFLAIGPIVRKERLLLARVDIAPFPVNSSITYLLSNIFQCNIKKNRTRVQLRGCSPRYKSSWLN